MNLLELRPSGVYAFGRVVQWLFLALLFTAVAWRFFPALILLSVLCAAIGFYHFLQVRSVCYRLNEEVLQVQSGIFFKRTDHLELFRVKDYVVTQNFFMQIFGLMSVELLTTDLTGPVVVLRGIPKSDIAEVIRVRVQRARQHNQIVELN